MDLAVSENDLGSRQIFTGLLRRHYRAQKN
jgi:hypothetical protein